MPRFRRLQRPPFRRFPHRRSHPLRRRAANAALNELRKAHALLAEGKPEEAAAIFSQLADAASARGNPRAASLYLQAGRAFIAADKVEIGKDRIRHGLTMMAATGRISQLPHIGRRILAELRARGLSDEARAIEADIQKMLSERGLSLATPVDRVVEERLPAKCPHCGGNVRPDEVEWMHQQQAACAYCGSRLA